MRQNAIIWEKYTFIDVEIDIALTWDLTYLIDCEEAGGVEYSDELDSVDGGDRPKHFRRDKATVDHGLGGAVGAIDYVLLTKFGTVSFTVVIVEIEHVEDIVDTAADH